MPLVQQIENADNNCSLHSAVGAEAKNRFT